MGDELQKAKQLQDEWREADACATEAEQMLATDKQLHEEGLSSGVPPEMGSTVDELRQLAEGKRAELLRELDAALLDAQRDAPEPPRVQQR